MRIFVDALSIRVGVNGGGETYVRELLRALATEASAHEFLIICQPAVAQLVPSGSSNMKVRYAPEFTTLSPALRVLYEQTCLPLIAKTWKADVIFFPGNMASVLAHTLRIPSVVVIHDASPFFYRQRFPGAYSGSRISLLSGLLRAAASLSSAVLTISEFSMREISRCCNVDTRKIYVVPHGGPENPETNVSFAALQEKYGIRTPYVLAVGRSHQHKNYAAFVRAFALARERAGINHSLVIAGPNGNGESDLQTAIESTSLQSDIVQTGYVSETELNSLYRSAELLAMPSLYEGFGFPVLEAMNVSVPVLISDTGALPEVGGEAACYVNPEDIESIAAGLIRVLCDAGYRNKLAAMGRIQARKFCWRKTALDTLHVCEAAANHNGESANHANRLVGTSS